MNRTHLLLALAALPAMLLAGCAAPEQSSSSGNQELEDHAGAQPGEGQACEGVDTGGAPVADPPDDAAGERDCPLDQDSTSGVPGVTSPDS